VIAICLNIFAIYTVYCVIVILSAPCQGKAIQRKVVLYSLVAIPKRYVCETAGFRWGKFKKQCLSQRYQLFFVIGKLQRFA